MDKSKRIIIYSLRFLLKYFEIIFAFIPTLLLMLLIAAIAGLWNFYTSDCNATDRFNNWAEKTEDFIDNIIGRIKTYFQDKADEKRVEESYNERIGLNRRL